MLVGKRQVERIGFDPSGRNSASFMQGFRAGALQHGMGKVGPKNLRAVLLGLFA